MQVRDKELRGLLGEARFFSVTYRLFKLPDAIETLCEDYGQACKYKASPHTAELAGSPCGVAPLAASTGLPPPTRS